MRVVYAAHHKNGDVLWASSSGGVFTACSDWILHHGGSIVAATYHYETHTLEHSVAVTEAQRDAMRGSKYFQSRIPKKVYHDIEQKLKKEQYVLFVGTPCQVKALQNYLAVKKADSTYLITIDLLCHGVGSPGIWRSYIELLSRLSRRKISYISFRDKRRGWHKPTCVASDGRREYSLRGYSWLYYANSIMRPCCHSCSFASFDRVGDITIGDYWGSGAEVQDAYHPLGTSVVLVNSPKGSWLMEQLQGALCIQKSSEEDCRQPNLERPTPCGKHRAVVMRDYAKQSPLLFFLKWSLLLLAEKLWVRIRK